jgi:hypothetical protein
MTAVKNVFSQSSEPRFLFSVATQMIPAASSLTGQKSQAIMFARTLALQVLT